MGLAGLHGVGKGVRGEEGRVTMDLPQRHSTPSMCHQKHNEQWMLGWYSHPECAPKHTGRERRLGTFTGQFLFPRSLHGREREREQGEWRAGTHSTVPLSSNNREALQQYGDHCLIQIGTNWQRLEIYLSLHHTRRFFCHGVLRESSTQNRRGNRCLT